jgi:hypothetical protein
VVGDGLALGLASGDATTTTAGDAPVVVVVVEGLGLGLGLAVLVVVAGEGLPPAHMYPDERQQQRQLSVSTGLVEAGGSTAEHARS